MWRKISVLAVLTAVAFGLTGTGSAQALTLPPGDGNVACSATGSVTIVRPRANPTTSKLKIAGNVGGCSYNGTPIPFAGGKTSTIAVGDPARWCQALVHGGTLAKTNVKIVVNRQVVAQVAISVTLAPVVPSGNGSALDLDGTVNTSVATIGVHLALQTDRPITDLCTGAATKVLFSGGVSADWTRN